MCGAVQKPLAMMFPTSIGSTAAFNELAGPKVPKMPDVVRTDPAADLKKTETDAAQQAQNARLLQRRAAKRNSLLSNAGAGGDTSQADVATPSVYGKPNLGG